ncbi:glycosyltransferase family 2 protein [Falsiroseomonas sp.]|uniref:glycosyltransferase family 2 protein n=1 Tax=Falsiroseomonas sp. TaxID=2870721 RepID=UPI0035647647
MEGGTDYELTVLMPCLNEAETLQQCIAAAAGFLLRNQVRGEILIADNGSTDGSREIALAAGARVVEVPERGYGAALRAGIGAARGRYIVMGDADCSYDFSALEPFLEELRRGSDLVMGNRFKGGIAPGAMPFLHRWLGNPVLSFVGRLFFGASIGDFHCGLRGFRADAIRALRLRTAGMEFASEMVVCAALAGLRITEVPTTLAKDGRSRPPHLRTWRDGWRHLKFLLIYSPRWLYILPGLVLTVMGALGAAILLFGPVRLDSIAFDLNTFVFCCFACLLGTQILTFGAVSRHFAAMSGLLPWSDRALMLHRWLTTERLAMLGGVVLLLGCGVFLYAFLLWASVSFGPLVDPMAPRAVIAGLTGAVIGLQLLFASFLIGMLRLPFDGTRGRAAGAGNVLDG